MLSDTIRAWLSRHPTVVAFLFLVLLKVSEFEDTLGHGATEAYAGP